MASMGVGVVSALPGPTTEWDVGGGGSCKKISAVGLLFCGYSRAHAAGCVRVGAYFLCRKEHPLTSGLLY